MKNLTALLIILFLGPGFAAAQDSLADKENEDDKKQPLQVTSQRMISEKKKQLISFYGDVVAIKGRLKVESDEMYVHTNEDQSDFKEIEALGSVIITRGDKVATGEKANYYSDTQQIILVGSPVLTQGKDVATGEKVVYFFDTEDMEVYGGEDQRSTLVLFPKEKKEEKKVEPEAGSRASATFGESGKTPAPEALDATEAPEANGETPEKMEERAPVKEAEPVVTDEKAEPEKMEELAPVKEAEPVVTDDKAQPEKKIEKEDIKALKVAQKPEEVAKPAQPREKSPPTGKTKQKNNLAGKLVWYTIQVGSHQNIHESIKLKKKLVKHGYNAYIRLFDEKGTKWYRVRIGGFKTKSTALRFAKKLEEKENLATLLIPYEP